MPAPDYGFTQGLAYQHNFQQDIENRQREEQLNRQARIDQESQAQLLGDKMKFGSASNAYDQKILKDYSENQVKEIGKFAHENPDFKRDPAKWAQFNYMTDQLMKHPAIYRSMRLDQNKKDLTDYMSRTPGSQNDPDIQKQLNEIKMYEQTGSTDGVEQNHKEFMFQSPDNYNPQADAERLGKGIGSSGLKNVGYGQTVETYDPQKVVHASELLYNTRKSWFDKQWKTQHESGNDTYATPTALAKSYIDPFLDPKYHAINYAPIDHSGAGGGKGAGIKEASGGLFQDTVYLDSLHKIPGALWNANPEGINAIHVDKDGYGDGRDVTFPIGGKNLPLRLDSRVRMHSTGKMTTAANPDGSRRTYSQMTVEVPESDFVSAFDGTDAGEQVHPFYSKHWFTNKVDITDLGRGKFTKYEGKDEAGNKINYIRFVVNKPTSTDQSAAAAYNKAMGAGAYKMGYEDNDVVKRQAMIKAGVNPAALDQALAQGATWDDIEAEVARHKK